MVIFSTRGGDSPNPDLIYLHPKSKIITTVFNSNVPPNPASPHRDPAYHINL